MPGRVLRGRSATDAVLQSLGSQGLILLLNLLSGVITARLLGPEGRGIFAAVTLWPMFFALIATAGLSAAVPFHVSRAPSRTASLVGSGLLVVTATSCLSTAAGIALIPLILSDYPPDIVFAAQVYMLVVVPFALHIAINEILVAIRALPVFNLSRIIPPLGYVLALGLVHSQAELTWAGAAGAQAASAVIALAFAVAGVAVLARPVVAGFRAATRRIVHFAARAATADVLVAFASQSDRILLLPFVSATELGYYVVAFGLSRIIAMAMPAINGLLLSRMTRADTAEAKTIHDIVFRTALLVFLAGGAAVAAIGRPVIVLLYGEEFGPVVDMFRILLAQAVVANLCAVTIPFLLSRDRPGTVSKIQAASFGATIAMVLLLVPSYGAIGAAVAILAATLLRLALLLLAVKVVLGLPLPRPYLNRVDLGYLRSRLLP